MGKKTLTYLLFILLVVVTASCSVYKYVPEGEYLLHSVSIESGEEDAAGALQLRNMLYQTPNTRWLGLFRIPLRIYSLSPKSVDENKGGESYLRNLGEKPVILDTLLCENSVNNIRRALTNAGYLKADVTREITYSRRPKADVRYVLDPGPEYIVSEYNTVIPDDAIDSLLSDEAVSGTSLISTGMRLDASTLDSERDRIATFLQTRGYYGVGKENVYFVADTLSGSTDVNLTLYVRPYLDEERREIAYPVFRLDTIRYILGGTSGFTDDLRRYSFVEDNGDLFYYISDDNGHLRLKPRIIRNHSFLARNRVYDSRAVSRTYSSLSNLGIVKYSTIKFNEDPHNGTLNADVYIAPYPKYSFAAELEGTNTAGDMGVAAQISLSDRNTFGGGEKLTMTLRGAFEAITNLPGYAGNSYREYGIEANLEFPELLLPFIKPEFQRRSQATSQLGFMLNSQNRPEFRKLVLTFTWSYLWRMRRHSHRIDLFDVNFLTVPWISDQFQKEYLDPIDDRHSILRYNYEDMLLTKIGYTYYYTNANANSLTEKPLTFTVRASAETSGNVLDGVSSLLGAETNASGQYLCLGVAFAQYLRSDGAFTLNWKIDKWNNLLFHAEYGLAYPYANSSSVPFEKRFYSGGANSVRGWAVRELGPGVYRGENNAVNYIKQAGDVKLGASVEFRAHLFWKLNAALFADAGNIWTIREYEEQPGGMFRFNEFYKQFGVSCGAGIRLDLNFLVFRVDYGKQIINPAYEKSSPEYFPIANSVDYRDYAFHFAIGYPF